MAEYTNSKGEKISKYWWTILEAGKKVGKFGKAVGRAIGPMITAIVTRIFKDMLAVAKQLGPEAMQIIYGLVKEAALKNMSGAQKLRWVIDKLWSYLGERTNEFTTSEVSAIINGVVLQLKKKKEID